MTASGPGGANVQRPGTSVSSLYWGRQPGWDDARACRPRNVERITIRPPVLLLQPGVFSFDLMKNRDVGIGVLPQLEEVLECLSGFRLLACERGAACQPQIRQ